MAGEGLFDVEETCVFMREHVPVDVRTHVGMAGTDAGWFVLFI